MIRFFNDFLFTIFATVQSRADGVSMPSKNCVVQAWQSSGYDCFFYWVGVACCIIIPIFFVGWVATIFRRKSSGHIKASNEIKLPSSSEISAMLEKASRQDDFFNLILGLIPCQVFIKDALDDFKYKIVNKNFSDYYKLSESDILEHNDFDIFESEVAKLLRQHDTTACASSGEVFKFDEDISFNRNKKEVFKSIKVCYKSSDGHPFLLGICVDVTEIVQNSIKLQKTQELWNLVINALPVNIFAKDADNNFRYTIANKTFCDFVGKPHEDVIGKTDGEIFLNKYDTEWFASFYRKVMANNSQQNFTEHPFDFRGIQHHMQTIKLPTVGPDGNRLLLGLSVDITKLDNMIKMEQIKNDVRAQAVSESSFGNVTEKISRTLMEHLHCSRVVFISYSKTDKFKLYHEECAVGIPSISESGIENHELIWNANIKTLKKDEVVLFEKLSAVPKIDWFFSKYPEYLTHSLAAVPVYTDFGLVGCLMIFYTRPHKFAEMDKNLLLAMSNILALASIREYQALSTRRAQEENQNILDNISIPLWLYDSDGRIILTNKAAMRLLKTPDKLEPFSCRNILQCADKFSACYVRHSLADGLMRSTKIKYNNRSYIVETNAIRSGSDNRIKGAVSSFFDVTELDSVITNSSVVNDCLSNLVMEGDLNRAIQKSIKSICECAGADRCYIFHFDTNVKTVSCYIEYAAQGRKNILDNIQNRPYSAQPDWEKRFAENSLLSFPNISEDIEKEGLESYRSFIKQNGIKSIYAHKIVMNGKFWGYLGLMYERTAHTITRTEVDFIGSIAYCLELMLVRKQYQTKIFDALRKAKAADKAKSMFLASMSHEIRTPLNAVIGFAELMKDGSLPQNTEREYLEAISDSGNALLALINDVLDLSKLEAGQMIFTQSLVDIAGLIREICNIFKQKCLEKKLTLIQRVDASIPAVMIDKLRVRQILFNLIGNAVKFTDNGSITVKASFEKNGTKSGNLKFSVIDTGVGISEEDQKRVFQMFVQSNALRGTQVQQNGTGLGLSICKRMIEKMNGELLLSSVLGKGSDFTTVLHDVAFGDIEQQVQKAHTSALLPNIGARVLVADDVKLNLKVMEAMLDKLGVEVVSVPNAEKALEALQNSHIDYLLTDLWMPGMNGAELAAKIRRLGDFGGVKIAAVTADAESGDNFDMSVFDAVLTKPITVEKLRNFICKK